MKTNSFRCAIVEEAFAALLGDAAAKMSLSVDATLADSCVIRRDAQGRTEVVGDSPISLAAGAYGYLKNHANIHLSWCGDQLRPAETPELLPFELRRNFPLPLRPYWNYCTFGYSCVWWDWPRWKREIDFMALNGVNMPLAVTGMEAVWLQTFRHFGLSESEICAFLSGPAFLPWQYMGNLDSHAGPLPAEWIATHLELGRKIVARERAWGMKTILPGFSGHVPALFARRFPHVRYLANHGWCGFEPITMIDPADPMFVEVSAVFNDELARAFGSDHYYSIDLFHERGVPNDDPAYLATCGRNVFDALRRQDPQAIWVMQAWSERREILAGIPPEALLMLDIGKQRLAATEGLYGLDTVWGTIHSFGGQTEIGGDLAAIPREIDAQRRKFPNLRGAGVFPESIENNPVLYELAFDCALAEERVDLPCWLGNYILRRYGRFSAAAERAWKLLLRDVYTARRGDPVFAARPGMELDRANAWAGFKLDDTAGRFFPAWGELLRAHTLLGASAGYRFDVVDLGRQALSALGMQFYRDCQCAFRALDPVEFRRAAGRFLELMLDCDRLLGTREEFSLNRWIAQARSWSQEPETQALYEKNARLQLTLWGPEAAPEPLFDYCCREWNGLLKEYYFVRWQMFFDFIEERLLRGEGYDESVLPKMDGRIRLQADEFHGRLYEFEQAFVHTVSAGNLAYGSGGEVETALELFEKYRFEGAETPLPAGTAAVGADVLDGFSGGVPVVLS